MLDQPLQKVASELRQLGQTRARAAQFLKQNASKISLSAFDFLEHTLTMPVTASGGPDAKIVAIDGGILGEELHSLDLFVARSCGVLFEYKGGAIVSHAYHPEKFPELEYHALHSLETHEFNWHKNLIRLNSELQCAIDSFKRFSPDALFLDGSIVPQVGDKPSRDSAAYAEYEKALEKMRALYSIVDSSGAALLGIIKDSRGKHFIELLQKSVPELSEFSHALGKTNDTTFLHSLLAPGERTPAFKYSSEQGEKLVLRDLGDWSKKIASFYIKPVEFDRPLRVDFLLPKSGEAAKIGNYASLVQSLSMENKFYAYPAILIEADLRAALGGKEIEIAYRALSDELGMQPELFKLRRNSRPFR